MKRAADSGKRMVVRWARMSIPKVVYDDSSGASPVRLLAVRLTGGGAGPSPPDPFGHVRPAAMYARCRQLKADLLAGPLHFHAHGAPSPQLSWASE